jgi:SAM-dependent methyltransferase
MKLKHILKSALSGIGLLSFVKSLRNGGVFAGNIQEFLSSDKPEIDHVVVGSATEYRQYTEAYAQRIAERNNIESRILSGHAAPFSIKGIDSVTEKSTEMYRIEKHGEAYNLRETCISLSTSLNSRIRATLLAIQQTSNKQQLAQKDVYLTEAVTDLFRWFEGKTKTLTGSEYLGTDMNSGETRNGIMHQDITRLSFANNSFDLGVCLEVLEHVPDFRKGFSELARVTRLGGKMFITVPFLELAEKTVIRASINADGTLVHHLEPEYHGDPVNKDGGILCFQHFGWDLVDELKTAGFSDVRVHLIWSARNLILGRHIIVFEAIK